MDKSTREKGKALEEFVLGTLKRFDSTLHRTKNSGANNEKGDIVGKFWKIECKYRDTEDITLKKKVWDKVCSEIRVGTNQTPLYILGNKHRDVFVVLDLNDFEKLLETKHGSPSWEEK